MAVYQSHGRFYLSFQPLTDSGQPGPRKSLTLHSSCATVRTRAEARDRAVAALVDRLRDHGQDRWSERVAREAAAATDDELAELDVYVSTTLCAGLRKLRSEVLTVRQFGEQWTSGELARRYPDHVNPLRSARDSARWLKKYVYPHIGEMALTTVGLDELEHVMAALPPHLGSASRRCVAQLAGRLMRLAHYPAKLIEASPVPERWLPRVTRGTFQFLYPAEEAQLLACTSIPVKWRLLWGLLSREAMRPHEGLQLRWENLDLNRGILTLSQHKTVRTSGVRIWSLDPGSRAALWWWRELVPGAARGQLFAGLVAKKLAEQLRAHLLLAGVTRAELHTSEGQSHALRAHDLRATGVTLWLAAGKSETFVMDRTGHTTSQMLQKYRRGARTAAELDLGGLVPLWWGLPECRAAYEEAMTRPVYAPRMRVVGRGQILREKAANGKEFAVIPPAPEPPQNPDKTTARVIPIGPRIQGAYGPFGPLPEPVQDPPRDPHPLHLRLLVAVSNRGPRKGLPSPHPLPAQSPSLLTLARLRRAA